MIARTESTTRTLSDPQLDVEEAAKELGMTVRFVRRLIAEQRIDYVKHGNSRQSPVRIRLSEIHRYLDEHTVKRAR